MTKGSTACGSAPIMSPAVFPVLADGLLKHSAAFSGNQTMTVKLPADFTCEKCTLQIIEFMSQHALNMPGGCFYHHCAEISVKGNTPTPDAGKPADAGKASSDAGETESKPDAAISSELDASSEVEEDDDETPPKKDAAAAVKDASSPRKDAGKSGTPAAAATDDGCSIASTRASGTLFSALALVALLRRRRRQRR